MASLRLKAAGFSHVGMKRKQNQDNFLVEPELKLFIVADGMGGHQGGETASRMAIETIVEYFHSTAGSNHLGPDPVQKLYHAIISANHSIQSKGQAEPELQGMGTTTTALYFNQERLYIGHVGDSRTYLVHPERIWQLTRDHSLVQEKLRAGLISRAQLKTDKMKNVITRSVGFDAEVDVDVYQLEPHAGDVFITCSDGLSGMIEDSEILKIVQEYACDQDSVEIAAQKLIEAANANGGDDNVTAVVVKIVTS